MVEGMDSPEENGTIIVDNEEEFWLLQVMGISEVDSGRREDCFGFKKNLGPLLTGKLFGYLVSNFGAGKGLQKLGLKVWRHSMVSPRKVCLTLEVGSIMSTFGCIFLVTYWVDPRKFALDLFVKSWIWDKNKVEILTPNLEYKERR